MVSRRIHKPMEGSWNDYQLYAQPTKIGGQQETNQHKEGTGTSLAIESD
jgi:hypothetical protein